LVENEEEGGIVGRNVDGVREAVDEDGDHEEEDAGTSFKVRCRLSSTQKDVLITMHEGELVGSLLRKLREKTGVSILYPLCYEPKRSYTRICRTMVLKIMELIMPLDAPNDASPRRFQWQILRRRPAARGEPSMAQRLRAQHNGV